MTLWDAIILGIVEGLTEFLPVSSTGHLILASELLGVDPKIADPYVVIIQLGAIMAVVVFYWQRIAGLVGGVCRGNRESWGLAGKIMTAFSPAAVLGLLLHPWIEAELFNHYTVAAALIVGGVAMIVMEKVVMRSRPPVRHSVDEMTFGHALAIGCAQCLSLWPGMSRSMSTIVGAQLCGFSNKAAAEFSFLLALPTLGAATLYKLFDSYRMLSGVEGVVSAMIVGNIVSFAVAFLAVWSFIRFVERVGMTPFGAYRIVLGVVVLLFLA